MTIANSLLHGRYEIRQCIGRGGMSEVYLAWDRIDMTCRAVKTMKRGGEGQACLLREGRLLQRLKHPALPEIADIISDQEAVYIIMEYIEGKTLDTILRECGKQPQQLVLAWGKQLCSVLDFLHAQVPPVIYRDMKPSNIILTKAGRLYLLDFGAAREYHEGKKGDTVLLGTRGYAAPEQFAGNGQSDVRTDIYGLGATLYHLVTGHNPAEPPYEMYPASSWDAQISKGLEAVILACTRFNPESRCQSAGEVLQALSLVERNVERQQRRSRKNGRKALAAAALISFGMWGAIIGRAAGNKGWLVYGEGKTVGGLIRMTKRCKADGFFSPQEEKELLSCLEEAEKGLEGKAGYGKLAWHAGLLYWYYDGYEKAELSGEHKTESARKAAAWFARAKEHMPENDPAYSRVKACYEAALFLSGKEGREYKVYFDSLVFLAEHIREEGEEAALALGERCIEAVWLYMDCFLEAGIEKERIYGLFETAFEAVFDMKACTGRNSRYRDYILALGYKTGEALSAKG